VAGGKEGLVNLVDAKWEDEVRGKAENRKVSRILYDEDPAD
jgi:hypothetical protein